MGDLIKDNRPYTERSSVGTFKPDKWLPEGISHKQSHIAEKIKYLPMKKNLTSELS